MFEILFGAFIIVMLVLLIFLSLRIQRIRLMKFNLQMRHEMDKIERNVDDFKKVLPDLVDREKLAMEREQLDGQIAELQSRLSQEGKKVIKLDKEVESDKKMDKALVRSVSKLEKTMLKLKARMSPKKPAAKKKIRKKAKKK